MAIRPHRGSALVEKLQARINAQYQQADRRVFATSGTSGGLVLALMALVNPGDEVIVFDPYFVSYPPLVELAGGRPVIVDTYPTFRVDLDRVRPRPHAKNEGDHLRQPGQSDWRHGRRSGSAGPGRVGPRARDRLDQRRNLRTLLLRRADDLARAI